MFDSQQLAYLLDLQARSYQLLLWLEGAYINRKLNFTNLHLAAESKSAIDFWIEEYFEKLPVQSRPVDRNSIPEFANILRSYMNSSFEMERDPSWNGCSCDLCTFALSRIRIRKIKPTRQDRFKARKLSKRFLKKLVNEIKPPARDRYLERVVDVEKLQAEIAIGTWADQLQSRSLGVDEGAALVVLWRKFAWDSNGRIKEGFEVTLELIQSAEKSLINFLTLDLENFSPHHKNK